jgi:hypothetical protein
VFEKILLPLDGSGDGEKALSPVRSYAAPSKASIVLIGGAEAKPPPGVTSCYLFFSSQSIPFRIFS